MQCMYRLQAHCIGSWQLWVSLRMSSGCTATPAFETPSLAAGLQGRCIRNCRCPGHKDDIGVQFCDMHSRSEVPAAGRVLRLGSHAAVPAQFGPHHAAQAADRCDVALGQSQSVPLHGHGMHVCMYDYIAVSTRPRCCLHLLCMHDDVYTLYLMPALSTGLCRFKKHIRAWTIICYTG